MRSRGLNALRIALTAIVICAVRPTDAHAQVLVTAERDLQFGALTPGIAVSVAPTDMMRSAQFRIDGRGRYQVTFALPAQLTRMGGGSIPLSWGAADGRLEIRNRITTFDPRQPLEFRVNPTDQDAQINLGGRALPAAGQHAGTYTATIVIMVVQTGS